jgi:DNA-binding XRE family transcriptional regulator
MAQVLAKVPGKTVKAKAKLVGVTRQAWYQWLDRTARPNATRARQLAKITGYSAEEIRGLDD